MWTSLKSKASDQRNEKTTHKLGENLCKRPDEGLFTKIYKELLKLNYKINNWIKKWAKNFDISLKKIQRGQISTEKDVPYL